MSTRPLNLMLPNSPNQRCLDRFSIADIEEDEDGLVPFWPLLVVVLKQPVTSPAQLIDVLDTVSNLLRGSSGDAGDYGTLKAVVERSGQGFFQHIWPKIVQLSLKLPDYFPSGYLPVLRPGDQMSLTSGQAACLITHQFLCSLQCPPWRNGYFDFSIWFASEQRHPSAVEMYFAALFCYLKDFENPEHLLETSQHESQALRNRTTYSLHVIESERMSAILAKPAVNLSPIEIVQVKHYSTEQQELGYQGPDGAVVISANKHVGFGQSATQEELFVGNCPEACPAVLLTPPLEDDEVLVIEGARPMLRITGQRRDVSWTPLDPTHRHGGRMLFMDALEIDELDDEGGLPDLKPEYLDREIKKAYTAFSSWNAALPATVWTGVWGCGAFNGDPSIKMVILWIAASLAGKNLHIICDPLHGEFPAKFALFVKGVPSSWTAHDLRKLLDKIPKDVKRLATIDLLQSMVHLNS